MLVSMRFSRSLTVIVFTLAFSSAYAVDSCSAVLGTWSHVHSFISEYRESHILPLDSYMPREESGFLITGKLGQSTAKVYLGFDPSNKQPVVVKMKSKIYMFWRELMVTEYLLSNAEIVPKILKAYIKDDGTTVIVREYFKGFTGDELYKERNSGNKSIPRELSVDAWSSLPIEQQRMADLFLKGHEDRLPFKEWFLRNSSRLEYKYRENWNRITEMRLKDPKLSSDIDDFLFVKDFHRGNLLFDVQRDRWIVFDP